MKLTPLISFSVAAMLCIGLLTTAIAGGRPAPPGSVGDNIALGKTYTLSPAPNYSGCTDAGDTTQLTDGVTTATAYFWTQPTTVGWGGPSSAPTIIIDLEQVQPIQQVAFYTAGGCSNVQWPSAINMSVSNDGINYYSAGDLVSLSNTQHNDAPCYGTYSLHCYDAALQTRGRYVKFEVIRNGYYVFADEIKVFRGANSYLGQNIALNKSYTMNSTPNYSGCSNNDSGDATQLTDGAYSSGSGYFWTQLSTVGWYLPPVNWINIDIDLGQNQPIEGVSFNTAAGRSDVIWPRAISILVSDNGIDYYNAGELVSLSAEHGLPPSTGYLIRSYWTDRLATHGRYVKIIVSSPSLYLFVDEIEVYQGNSGMLTQPSRGTAIPNSDSGMANYVKRNQIRAGIARRVVLDANNVQAQTDAQSGLTQAVRDEIKSLLNMSLNEVIYLPDSNPATFTAELPLNYSHARVFLALNKLWQAQGKTGLLPWQTASPWDPLDPIQAPTCGTPAVSVRMLQNEYRAAAFNLSNPTDNDLTVSLSIQGLPGGTNPPYITVHEVAWTDTKEGSPTASALPFAAIDANGYIISIPSGMTRQVWMTFHPTITNPGMTSGTIVANGGTAGTVNIPITFQLSCLGLPAQPTLSFGGFDYTNCDTYGGMTLQNRDAFITHLREHFVDTTWGTAAAMPNPATFANFDAWASRWPGVRNYKIYLAVGATFNGYTKGTPEFNAAVATWINAYAAHWQGMGLNLNQIALHLVDETSTADQADTVTQWTNAIHAGQPNLKIWNDPGFSDPSVSYAQSMFQAVDILCPNRPTFIAASEVYRDVFLQQRNAGKTLNFYSCRGPASKLDPYSYYRLQAWECIKENAVAMHYWAFGGESCWNEYNLFSVYNYGPFFLNDTSITAGKAMEAIREGVEDYEYLVMLKNRITYLEGQPNPPDLTAPRALRDDAADAVLNATGAGQLNWEDAKDRGIADQQRLEILDMLETLGPQTGDNIAKGKTYTLSSAPNYWGGCTDAGDATQLTDGTYTSGLFWTQLSTVGWYNADTETITIDLGSIQPIQGVSYNTAAGSGGVLWPAAIDISVSNDGTNYTNIGELVSISNSEHGDAHTYTYQTHRYWTKSLAPAANGRFVKIAVTGSPYMFVDEIEIYR